jgi:hypothetical protein
MVNGKLPDHDLPPREASMVDANAKSIQAMDILDGKLKDAAGYSKDAFQGVLASARASIVQSLPWVMPNSAIKGANATKQMDIITTGQSLGQAKNDAGSRVTAFLEKLEQRLRAEPDMPQATRDELIAEARKFIKQNRDFAQRQNDAILNRTAFKPGANVNSPQPPDVGDGPSSAPDARRESELLNEARAGLSRGKNPNLVRQRLQQLGIDPGKL